MKIRLNKKNKEELSTSMVLSTLKTKQTQVEDDITTYIDEPFLKPENIRHGITMAGIDGKYAEVKYVSIYNFEGDLLCILASTEPNPILGREDDSIFLTNKPFDNQFAYNIGIKDKICYFRCYDVEGNELPDSQNQFYDDPLSIGQQTRYVDAVIVDGLTNISDAFVNISELPFVNIPYYVELPTELTDFGLPHEDFNIGETSRMLIYRHEGEMLLAHYMEELEAQAPGIVKISDNILGSSRVVIYETLSQRIILQYLFYDYLNPAVPYMNQDSEVRVIEDSKTGEFRHKAFSTTGYRSENYSTDYEPISKDVLCAMIYNDENSPSSFYNTGTTSRYPGCMGFVFRLNDGSFFIIDGGQGGQNEYYTYLDSMAPTLMKFLEKYAPDPENIRISGWLLTHLHQDHIGVFCEFIENLDYKSKISIDKVIYSLPIKSLTAFRTAQYQSVWASFENVLNTLRSEGQTEIIKAHMGQSFSIADLYLKILSAPENVLKSYNPKTETYINDLTDINDTSIVCEVEFEGQHLVFLSDAIQNQIEAVISPLFAEYIADNATIIQVAHHGYKDSGAELLYSRIGSDNINNLDCILWPVCYEHYSGKNTNGTPYQEGASNYTGVKDLAINELLINAKHVYPEGNQTMVAVHSLDSTSSIWSWYPVNLDPECTHIEGSPVYIKNSDNSHTKLINCSQCGAEISATTEVHEYDTSGCCIYCGYNCTHPSTNIVYTQNSGTHDKTTLCSICGAIVRTEREACSYGDSGRNGYCVCGNYFCDHEFGSPGYEDNGDGTHTMTQSCYYCGETITTTAAHSFASLDDSCICGAVRPSIGNCAHCGTAIYDAEYSICEYCNGKLASSCSCSSENCTKHGPNLECGGQAVITYSCECGNIWTSCEHDNKCSNCGRIAQEGV